MSTRWRSSSRRRKQCPGDLAIEASCPSLAQLEMPVRMLIQTAVKQLPGHGKTLTVPEKTANGCNNFPHLIKIKHFVPQLRGRKGAGADWQEGDRTWHLSKSLPKGSRVKTYVDSAVQCCRKWAVTAISPGLAQFLLPFMLRISPAALLDSWGGYVYSVMVASTLHLDLS